MTKKNQIKCSLQITSQHDIKTVDFTITDESVNNSGGFSPEVVMKLKNDMKKALMRVMEDHFVAVTEEPT